MGIKSVISLLAIYFFVPSCDFPERIKLNNTQYKHFLFKDPCSLSLWCQSFNCNYNLPIRQTPFSVTVRDGSDCVHLPTYSLYPGQANISYILLQNEVNHVHEKQEAGSARRVTCPARSLFCDGRVTLLAGPTFLQPACPARTTQSRCDNQSICERCFRQDRSHAQSLHKSCLLGQKGQLFSHINAHLS